MDNKDQDLENFRKKFLEMLKDISYLGKRIDKKSTNIVSLLEKPDTNSTEEIGIKIVELLKSYKENLEIWLNTLQEDLVSINSNRQKNDHLLCGMQSMLSNCRSSVTVNKIDKETMTNISYNLLNTNIENVSTTESNTSVSILNSENESFSKTSSSNINSLSLKREAATDTSQTEDENWNDTLQRIPGLQTDTCYIIKEEEEDKEEERLQTDTFHTIKEEKEKSLNHEISNAVKNKNRIEDENPMESTKVEQNETEDVQMCQNGSSERMDNNSEESMDFFEKISHDDEEITISSSDTDSNSSIDLRRKIHSLSTSKIVITEDCNKDTANEGFTKDKNNRFSAVVDVKLKDDVHQETSVIKDDSTKEENNRLEDNVQQKRTTNKGNTTKDNNNKNRPVSINKTKKDIQQKTCVDQESTTKEKNNRTAQIPKVNLEDEVEQEINEHFKDSTEDNENTTKEHDENNENFEEETQTSEVSISTQKNDTSLEISEQNITHDAKENGDDDELSADDYENPYSVSTEKCSSEEEREEEALNKTNLYNDHSYSAPQTDTEENTGSLNNKALESEIFQITGDQKDLGDQNKEFTASMSDSDNESSDNNANKSILSQKKELKTNGQNQESRDSSIDSCDDNEHLKNKKEKPNDQEMNPNILRNSDIELNNSTIVSNTFGEIKETKHELDLNENSRTPNESDNINIEDTKTKNGLNDQNQVGNKNQALIINECSSNSKNLNESTSESLLGDDNNPQIAKKDFTYINNEHDYSSSNSPQFGGSDNGFDSDETDIDKEVDQVGVVQLNKLNNFSLIDMENDPNMPRTDSAKSFVFDVSNYGNSVDNTQSDGDKNDTNPAEDKNDTNPAENKIDNIISNENKINDNVLLVPSSGIESLKDIVEETETGEIETIGRISTPELSTPNVEETETGENEMIGRTSTPELSTPNVEETETGENEMIGRTSTPELSTPNVEETETGENEVIGRTSKPELSTPNENEQGVTTEKLKVDEMAVDLENLLNQSLQKNSELKQENEENSDALLNEDLLDCTLEEILPQGGEEDYLNSQNTIIYDIKPNIDKIKIENESIHLTNEDEVKKENCQSKSDNENLEVVKDICDELLELLKEVPVLPLVDPQTEVHEIEEDSDASLKAEEILQAFNKSQTEISSLGESDSDINLSDFSVSSVKINDSDSETDDEIKKKLKEYNFPELSILLERMKMTEKDIQKFSKEPNDDIDWLCDLNNLNNKRKKGASPSFNKHHRKKSKKSSSDSSDSSMGSSSSESDNQLRSDSPNLEGKLEHRLDEILANAICNGMKSDSSEDSDSDSESSTKKNKREKDGNTNHDKSEKPQLTEEELKKKSWRKDNLLTSNLLDSDSEKSKSKKKRYEDDTDFNMDSDNLDSDSDFEDMRPKIKSKFDENYISPIKRNLPESDSSDSDSDVQFVSPEKSNIENGDAISPSQKGRRQIRSILSDRDLDKETIRAKKEEMERIERLKGRHKIIESMSQTISSQQSDQEKVPPLILDFDEDSGEPLIQVNQIINKKLKPHQREGVQFMWDSCYESVKRLKVHPGSGCILAHCMGLGKTLQVLTLSHTLFSYDETNTKHILIVCPLSTVNNWGKETKFAFKGLKKEEQFNLFTIGCKKNIDLAEKYNIVKRWRMKKKSLLVLGYECFETLINDSKLEKASANLRQIILESLVDPGPDLVVCDEGHLIKNKKALKTLALYKISTKRRIILTGTPLQNNLTEYYYMVHFVKPSLLGTITEFKTNFANPITNGQFEDSNQLDINLMMKRTHVLHKVLLKTVQRVEDTELEIYLPRMYDHAVFIQLHQVQVDLYTKFSEIASLRLHQTKNNRNMFLVDFRMLQYICTHPQLLVIREQSKKKNKEKGIITNEEDPPDISFNTLKDKIPEDSFEKIDYGTKMVVLKAIIEECEAIEDKLLVFSQSLCELDLIEHVLKNFGTKNCPSWKKNKDYHRMDGNVPPSERSVICDIFNDESRKTMRLLLISTKVGGLGLNLTAANRVVIMTVHWNPSYDTQSVFRCYRFGQKKEVFVYRLVAMDTMESKVYQRQVTKLAIAHRVVDKHHITRHYKSIDLQELYSCKPSADNERPTPNVPEDEVLAKLILKLPCIFKYHEHKSLLADRPEDKLSEQELATAWEDFKNNKDTFRVPGPQPTMPQQMDLNTPTFNMAYNLRKINSRRDFDLFAGQYYNPQQNVRPPIAQFRYSTSASQLNQSTGKESDIIFVSSKFPQSRQVVNRFSSKNNIPLTNKAKDPIYTSQTNPQSNNLTNPFSLTGHQIPSTSKTKDPIYISNTTPSTDVANPFSSTGHQTPSTSKTKDLIDTSHTTPQSDKVANTFPSTSHQIPSTSRPKDPIYIPSTTLQSKQVTNHAFTGPGSLSSKDKNSIPMHSRNPQSGQRNPVITSNNHQVSNKNPPLTKLLSDSRTLNNQRKIHILKLPKAPEVSSKSKDSPVILSKSKDSPVMVPNSNHKEALLKNPLAITHSQSGTSKVSFIRELNNPFVQKSKLLKTSPKFIKVKIPSHISSTLVPRHNDPKPSLVKNPLHRAIATSIATSDNINRDTTSSKPSSFSGITSLKKTAKENSVPLVENSNGVKRKLMPETIPNSEKYPKMSLNKMKPKFNHVLSSNHEDLTSSNHEDLTSSNYEDLTFRESAFARKNINLDNGVIEQINLDDEDDSFTMGQSKNANDDVIHLN